MGALTPLLPSLCHPRGRARRRLSPHLARRHRTRRHTVLVHAKGQAAKRFYLASAEFIEYPADSRILFLPIEMVVRLARVSSLHLPLSTASLLASVPVWNRWLLRLQLY
jgi:hypothetical protein